MLDKTRMKFSHVRPTDTDFGGEGLRDFFVYRDLGIAEATVSLVGDSRPRGAGPERAWWRSRATGVVW